jgi:hypothetical protein
MCRGLRWWGEPSAGGRGRACARAGAASLGRHIARPRLLEPEWHGGSRGERWKLLGSCWGPCGYIHDWDMSRNEQKF